MMISQSSIEEIKDKASLLEIVSESVNMRRQGSSFVGLCPFHSEKSPSFHVREHDNSFHCFGCGESGNVISYVMKSRALSFPEAIDYLSSRFGVTVQREGGGAPAKPAEDKTIYARVNKYAQQFFRMQLERSPQEVRDYIAARGLRPEAIDAFGIGFCPRGESPLTDFLKGRGIDAEMAIKAGLARRASNGNVYDSYAGRLTFPIAVDNSQIAGFGGRVIPALQTAEWMKNAPKYINSPETPLYQKSKILYGVPQALPAIRESGEVFVVEGYLDVIGLWQAGVWNVIATCGTALTDRHLQRLSRMCGKAFVLFDGDAAGRAAAAKSFQLFLTSEVDGWALFLPDGEDPDSYAAKHGQATCGMLAGLDRHSLLECYIDSLVQKEHCANVKELGASAAERVVREVAKSLSKMEKQIARHKLVEEAAFRLHLKSPEQFESMLSQGPAAAADAKPPAPASDAAPKGEAKIRPVDALPKLDQELLLCAMAKRAEFAKIVLNDPDMCIALSYETLDFIQQMSDLIESTASPDAQKDKIKVLLTGFGPTWIQHWKKAFSMLKDREVDFDDTYQQCRTALEAHKLHRSWSQLSEMIDSCAEPEEKAKLVQRRLEIEREAESKGLRRFGWKATASGLSATKSLNAKLDR